MLADWLPGKIHSQVERARKYQSGRIGAIVQVAKLSPREVIACLPLPSRVQFPSRDALREQFLPARHGPFPLMAVGGCNKCAYFPTSSMVDQTLLKDPTRKGQV